MSGGLWEYKDQELRTQLFGYDWEDGDDIKNVLEDREISELVYDIFGLLHSFDWYKCGDTGKDSYVKNKTQFKNKWFHNNDTRVKRTIDAAISDLKEELYETYGIQNADKTHQEIDI